ncbi:MAG: zf-HC2 domain-containing protein [Clostridia bacterium]|nr:zf-HC2 domain-containing protein [Clostridia bacterium]
MSEHTLKQECALARELMPLDIEGVASEESARFVKEHISGCTECAVAYGEEKERQRQAMENAAAREGEKFRQDMRRMKRKWALRMALSIAGVVALTLGLITGGFGLESFLTANYQFTVSPDEYDLTLYRLEDNRIVAQCEFAGEPFSMGTTSRWENGEMRLSCVTTAIRHAIAEPRPFADTGMRWQDGKIFVSWPEEYTGMENGAEVTSVSVTNGRRGNSLVKRVIWTQGEDIPLYTGAPAEKEG